MINSGKNGIMQTEAVSDLLGRCAFEMRVLAEHMTQFEDTMLNAPTTPKSTSGSRQALQSIDILTQSIDAMAHFLDDLAAATPVDYVVESNVAVANVPLAKMRSRLVGNFEAEVLQPDTSGHKTHLL